ncbi:Ferrous iron transport periplasmic protein EfeO, contains peptidase-M75 domain and (frequently) cupredoxin-like domain [Rhodococcus wratislaviensis]|uniref:Ferrous iron transport periplasmic protein EfeO, contains peptidase-M75 domain and (Frequently) cupredoxin-like domain n=1 Tax=Rhodococcus wratislaviensis TaxID=44752 RepID=A0A402BYL3_RHOWR|nr:iron uptake system protein EfeO [Rhodococcus wratislaviensis]GCE36441.1 Ferrous iron transport periplasmic protein EfeO, contains peptidase-M75 domain and (frequently) cupredoxin-like domain [Rhodococcus wratislaviensis]
MKTMRRSTFALASVAVLPLALAGCTEKSTASTDDITVTASDETCDVSADSGTTGSSTFQVTNNGSKVTEFYVYAEGDRAMGEVENIGPGLTRQLIVSLPDAGTYQLACKPGMVGNGIRQEFTVTGDSMSASDESGQLAEAADGYRRYIRSQVVALQDTTQQFVDAVKAGNIDQAKALFPVARTYYERIEPEAESFGELDPKLDLREADLEPGQEWTGFHRLEKDLWVTGPQPDTNAIADQLVVDVQYLADQVNAEDYTIDPTKIAGDAQGLLDEISTSKITGEEDIFSHTDLWDFQANVDGSQAAVAALQPIIEERNPELAANITQRFADLDAELAQYRQGDGFVFYDTVNEQQRQELSRKIDALSAEVSQVQGVVAGA